MLSWDDITINLPIVLPEWCKGCKWCDSEEATTANKFELQETNKKTKIKILKKYSENYLTGFRNCLFYMLFTPFHM